MRRSIVGITMLVLVMVAGCGDGGSGPAPAGPAKVNGAPLPPKDNPADAAPPTAAAPTVSFAPTRADAVAYNPQDGGTISGVCKLKADKAPRKLKVNFAEKDAKCVNEEQIDEKLLVSKELGIKNVFVMVTKGQEGLKFSTPTDSVKITQKGCQYSPRVFGVFPGQKVDVKNGDDTTHNVHTLPAKSKEFNKMQPTKDIVDTTMFENAEMAVKIKCDIHPWMFTYAFVIPHTLWCGSDVDGKFSIAGLPDGKYELLAWHEVYGEQKMEVTVKDKKAEANFTFEKK